MTRDQMEQLAHDHGSRSPTPGTDEVELRFRPSYGREVVSFYVPADVVSRATSEASQASASGDNTASTATTSAGVAPDNSDRVMVSAVFNRSYTKRAARASSGPPSRSMMRRRESNASVLVNVFMGSLSVLVVVEDPHRRAGTGARPLAQTGGAA